MSKPTPNRDPELVKKVVQVALEVAEKNEGEPIDIVTRLRAAMFFAKDAGLDGLYEKLEIAEKSVKL